MRRQRNIDCQWKRIGRVPQTALAEKHGLLTQHTNDENEGKTCHLSILDLSLL
jgi:hypothetical protein